MPPFAGAAAGVRRLTDTIAKPTLVRMKTRRISKQEFSDFVKGLPSRRLSCNPHKEIWQNFEWSFSQLNKRGPYLQGKWPLLDLIVQDYLEAREDGGQFVISENGDVHHEPEGRPRVKFLHFELT